MYGSMRFAFEYNDDKMVRHVVWRESGYYSFIRIGYSSSSDVNGWGVGDGVNNVINNVIAYPKL
jgi:hypothetical protein